MATHKSAMKRIRSDERKRQRNRVVRSRTRTSIKTANMQIAQRDVEAAREATQVAIKSIDQAISRGVLHKNTGARQKSRLMARFNAMD